MNARALTFLGETEPLAWTCGECGSVRLDESAAARCCNCHGCGVNPPPRPGVMCAACQARWQADRVIADRLWLVSALRKAARLTPAEYAGPVCTDPRGDEHSYHATLDDYLDGIDPEAAPEESAPYVWACTVSRPQMDVADMLANIEESDAMQEGYVWTGEDELRAYLTAWFARQSPVWSADPRRVVVLDAARFEALLSQVQL